MIDPLGHCQGGAKYFSRDLIEGRVLLPIFQSLDLFQNKTTTAEKADAVTFYVMSSNDTEGLKGEKGNYWTSLKDWPDYTEKKLYLTAEGTLADTPPLAGTSGDAITYKYDPQNPVPR